MQKIPVKNKPIILKNTDFQTIIIKVLFPFHEELSNLAKNQLLPSMLNFMNEVYPTEELFQKAKKRLYILGASCSQATIGNEGCFSFTFVIPDTHNQSYTQQPLHHSR